MTTTAKWGLAKTNQDDAEFVSKKSGESDLQKSQASLEVSGS